MTSPEASTFRSLPKALLHEHLDGGLRPATLLELARAANIELPTDDADALARWITPTPTPAAWSATCAASR